MNKFAKEDGVLRVDKFGQTLEQWAEEINSALYEKNPNTTGARLNELEKEIREAAKEFGVKNNGRA